MQIKDADGKELRRCLKKVMKGRPLYFISHRAERAPSPVPEGWHG